MKKAATGLELLVVEDNPADLYLIKEMLRSSHLIIKTIYETSRLEEAYRLIESKEIHLALLDLSLPDGSGIDSYLSIRKVNKKIPVIILTGLQDTDVAVEAIQQGAQDYLIKGEFNSHGLSRAVQYSIERMQNLENLRESEEKYRQMFNRNPFPSMILDLATLRILEVNHSAIEKYGYSRDEFLEMTLEDIRPPEDIPELFEAIAKGGTRKGEQFLMRHQKKNGELLFMEVSYYPIGYYGKTAMQAQMNDVTERMRLEDELAKEREIRQRQITAAVLEAQEKERIAIGEELHDNINQIITSVRLYIDLARKKPEHNDAYLVKSMEYISMAIEENRKLAKALILPQLKGLGLVMSLEELKEQVAQSSSLEIKTNIQHFDETRFTEQEKISLYRIVQEQLNNIINHAKAKTVTIELYGDNGQIILTIKDDGIGFDTSVRSSGVGLTNINSRAEVLNGKVQVDSAPGRGCILRVILNAA
ncbi:MAG: response regulator [Bacteroidota bacterium]|nr:response regulator [Bacteroidota bacterium]